MKVCDECGLVHTPENDKLSIKEVGSWMWFKTYIGISYSILKLRKGVYELRWGDGAQMLPKQSEIVREKNMKEVDKYAKYVIRKNLKLIKQIIKLNGVSDGLYLS